ncbi:MAG: serine hydrolase [Coxiellaceae bacterium]|nr:serine hydrolase [Coxiellaceae bacterium]
MKTLIPSLLCLTLSTTAFAANPIQTRIDQQVARDYNVGISVAVITPKTIRYYHAGKLSKATNAKAVDKNTLFQIASISKVMTSLMAAEAVKQHKIKLSNPVNDYLPKNTQIAGYKNTPITVSDCVAHLSGLPSNPTNLAFNDPENIYAGYTEADFLQFIRSVKPTIKPGSRYIYSNTGYALVGTILSRLYQKPYADLLHTKVTQPLQMNNTFVNIPQKYQSDLASNYGADDKLVPYMDLGAITPAGGVTSNTDDLAKFVRAFMGITKTPLYPAMQLAIQPIGSEGMHSKDGNFSGHSAMSIAMGWNIDPEHHAAWKNGNLYGVSSFVGFNNDKTLGVVVLANTGNVSYTDNLALRILDPNVKLMPLYQQIKQPKKINQRYAGTYRVNQHEAYSFKPHSGLITATHLNHCGASRPFNLYPMSATKYFGKVDNAVFTFTLSKKQQVTGFALNENGHMTYATIKP